MLFMIRGDGSLGSLSCNTSHYSSHHRNEDDVSSEEEGIEVSSGEEILGHRYLETSQYFLSNIGGRESLRHRSQ